VAGRRAHHEVPVAEEVTGAPWADIGTYIADSISGNFSTSAIKLTEEFNGRLKIIKSLRDVVDFGFRHLYQLVDSA